MRWSRPSAPTAARSAASRSSCTSPIPAVRERLAKNFSSWTDAIEECLVDGGRARCPPDVNRRALAEFVLTTMEGGVMLARSYRDIGYFDRAIGELREYFNRLLRPAARPSRPGPQRRKQGEVSCLTSTGSPCWPRRFSAFLLGGLWYSPAMFLKAWQRGAGLSDEQLQKGGHPGKIYGGAFVLVAGRRGDLRDVPRQAPGRHRDRVRASAPGSAWVAASFGINYLFERKPFCLFLVNGGYHTVQFTLYGLILGLGTEEVP